MKYPIKQIFNSRTRLNRLVNILKPLQIFSITQTNPLFNNIIHINISHKFIINYKIKQCNNKIITNNNIINNYNIKMCNNIKLTHLINIIKLKCNKAITGLFNKLKIHNF